MTPIPLLIWVEPCDLQREEVQEWIRKGHTVEVFLNDTTPKPDLILSPRAYRMEGSLWAFAENALKRVRLLKKRAISSSSGMPFSKKKPNRPRETATSSST